MPLMPSHDHLTLHMLPVSAWAMARAAGFISPDSLAREGFVHCTDGDAGLVVESVRRILTDCSRRLVFQVSA